MFTAKERKILAQEALQLREDRRYLARRFGKQAITHQVALPMHIPYLLAKALANVPARKDEPVKATDIVMQIRKVIKCFDTYIDSVPKQKGRSSVYDIWDKMQDTEYTNDSTDTLNALALLKCYLRQQLNIFKIFKLKLTKPQLDYLVEDILISFHKGRVSVGEHVGGLAAQALAEPLMQMVLNAIHRTNISSDSDIIPSLNKLLNG